MEINILQILPDDTIVRAEKDMLNLLFKNKVSEVANILRQPLKNISRYKTGARNIPINVFKQLCTLNNLSSRDFQNKIWLKVTASGTEIKLGPYIDIDEKWVYVAELIRGDGHIPANYWSINFINQEKALIDYVLNFFSNLGVPKTSIYLFHRHDADFLTIRNFTLAYLFSKLFAIPTGKKGEMHLPEFFFQNESFMKAAIRGAFDAEGSVQHYGSRRITITSNSISWLEDLQTILEKLNITSRITKETYRRNKPIYRIIIYHQLNLKRFLSMINPFHPKRRNKLLKILSTYSNKNPAGFWRHKILQSIKNGYVKRKEIAATLQISKKIVGNYLWWLQRQGLIEPSKKIWTNKGGFYEYALTRKGLSYINIPSHSFFD
jgi:hypothetical protein